MDNEEQEKAAQWELHKKLYKRSDKWLELQAHELIARQAYDKQSNQRDLARIDWLEAKEAKKNKAKQ